MPLPIGQPNSTGPLGIDLDLEPDDVVTDALLIMKVLRPDGSVEVAARSMEGTDWITQRGLIAAVDDIERGGYLQHDGDDDS